MFRKLLATFLIILYTVSFAGTAVAAEQDLTMLDKTVVLEKYIYGSEQTGALLDRVAKLEKDLYGSNTKDALAVKLDKMYNYLNNSSVDSPSFKLKLNAVEWALTHNTSSGLAKNRVEALERLLMGKAVDGSLDSRLGKLAAASYDNGHIDTANGVIAKDSLVKIKLISPLATKTSRPGDEVIFQVSEDVYANGVLVIAKGAQGMGKVVKVEPAKNFGRDAQMQISFDTVEAVDGTIVSTVLGDKAKEENKSLVTAAGASIAGMAILGPIGIVGGAFVHGKDIELPAGTELYVQTQADTNVIGLVVK